MAIVILGQTRCCLCGRLLLEGEDVVSFPPLFYNQRDPAWVLNDAGAHRACMVEHGLADRALRKLQDVENHRGRPKVCVVCGQSITGPDDYFSTGPLGDGLDDPLYAVSWIEAHLSHLSRWRELLNWSGCWRRHGARRNGRATSLNGLWAGSARCGLRPSEPPVRIRRGCSGGDRRLEG